MRSAVLLLALPLAVGAAPRIVYSKSFPGSKPEFVQVTVEQDGRVEYKEAADDDPFKFKLDPQSVEEIFALAQKLDRFGRPLESGLKVANMGMKTYRWEDGAQKSETKFNYSLDLDAQALQDKFERITETESHLINLQRTARFDRLGVNQVLLQIEVSWDRKRLVAADQFLPWLDRVAKNESYLNIARERAVRLAEAFRAPRPAE